MVVRLVRCVVIKLNTKCLCSKTNDKNNNNHKEERLGLCGGGKLSNN